MPAAREVEYLGLVELAPALQDAHRAGRLGLVGGLRLLA